MGRHKAGLFAGSALSILAALFTTASLAQVADSTGGSASMSSPAYGGSAFMATSAGDDLGNHTALMNLDLSGFRIINLNDPEAGSTGQLQAVNRRYVDAVVAGARDNLGNHIATMNLNMANSFAVIGLPTPVGASHAANKAYVDSVGAAARDNLGNHTATMVLNMGGRQIQQVANPTAGQDAATKSYVDAQAIAARDNLGNHTATQNLSMAGFAIQNLLNPVAAQDAATKKYVDDKAATIVSDVDTLRNRKILAGTGLLGGGDLTADRTLSFNTTWGDGRYALASRTISANDGLSGGGPLSGNIALSVDGTVVRTAGAQTIAGVKTFTNGISVNNTRLLAMATPTAGTDGANKAYVDGQIAALPPPLTYSAGDGLTLTGTTFSTNGTVVRTTGAQDIGGVKTFTAGDLLSRNALSVYSAGTAHLWFRNDDNSARAVLYHGLASNNLNAQLYHSTTGAALGGLVIRGTDGWIYPTGTAENGTLFNFHANGRPITGVPAPTAGTDAANKSYVDGKSYTAGSGLSLTGTTLAVDGTVVRTTGNQTISGVKTYDGTIIVNGTSNTPDVVIARTNSSINANMAFTTTGAGDIRIGQGDNGWFNIGASDDIRWLTATGATGVFGIRASDGYMRWAGVAAGNGSGITALNANNLATGTVPDARLPADLVYHARTIATGAGLQGGGNLSANRTLSLQDNYIRRNGASVDAGVMAHNGDARAAAQFYSGTTNPSSTTRVNFDASLYATRFYSTMYLYFSDRTLKKDIALISGDDGMEKVRALRPVSYAWKENGDAALGVIAQEVEEVLPTAVKTNEVGLKAVDYQQMIAPMLAAIQQLDARVSALETAH